MGKQNLSLDYHCYWGLFHTGNPGIPRSPFLPGLPGSPCGKKANLWLLCYCFSYWQRYGPDRSRWVEIRRRNFHWRQQGKLHKGESTHYDCLLKTIATSYQLTFFFFQSRFWLTTNIFQANILEMVSTQKKNIFHGKTVKMDKNISWLSLPVLYISRISSCESKDGFKNLNSQSKT